MIATNDHVGVSVATAVSKYSDPHHRYYVIFRD